MLVFPAMKYILADSGSVYESAAYLGTLSTQEMNQDLKFPLDLATFFISI